MMYGVVPATHLGGGRKTQGVRIEDAKKQWVKMQDVNGYVQRASLISLLSFTVSRAFAVNRSQTNGPRNWEMTTLAYTRLT